MHILVQSPKLSTFYKTFDKILWILISYYKHLFVVIDIDFFFVGNVQDSMYFGCKFLGFVDLMGFYSFLRVGS